MYKPTNTPMCITDLNSMKSGRSMSALFTATVVIALLFLSIPATAQDTEPPEISLLYTSSSGYLCIEFVPEPWASYMVSAYDAVSGSNVYVEWVEDVIEEQTCTFEVHRTYSATDPSGNTAYATVSYYGEDTWGPGISEQWSKLKKSVVLKCGSELPAPDPTKLWIHFVCEKDGENYGWGGSIDGVRAWWDGDTWHGTGCDAWVERVYRAENECGKASYVQVFTFRKDNSKETGNGGGKGGRKK